MWKKEGIEWRLEDFKSEMKAERMMLEARVNDKRRGFDLLDEKAKSMLAGKLRVGSKFDYEDWLTGYMLHGNDPTQYFDIPWFKAGINMFVATNDFQLTPLYGVSAISVLVPKGIKFIGGELGHSKLYFEEEYRMQGEFLYVPVYGDTYVRPKKEETKNEAPLTDREVMG